MSLKIVERFFCEVSNYLLRDPQQAYDVSVVKENLRVLKGLSPEADDFQIEQSDKKLDREFARWREHLSKLDGDIEAFELRRFCDSFRGSFDRKIFFSLARFYRALPLSTGSQCKFDLMMTRAFEGDRVGQARISRFDRDKTANQIDELYLSWHECPQLNDLEQSANAEEKYDEFIDEANSLMHFEDLIASNIFERIRELKRNLGVSYFQPQLVAAAIETNILVGNTFGSLLAQLNSNLHVRLSSQVDFAGVLIDGSVSERSDLIDILGELADESELAAALSANSDLAILQMLMRQSSRPREEVEDQDADFDGEYAVVEDHKPILVKQRLSAQLETLTQEQPNTAILRDYMRTSPALNALDLNDFLFESDGEPDVLGRRALAAILCLEEFKENDLKGAKQLEQELSHEMLSMLHFAERIGEEINDKCLDCEVAHQAKLLIVANKLLTSRLHVERAVVRFAAPVEEVVEEVAEEQPWPEDNYGINKTAFLEANRWLMGLTIFMALAVAASFFFTPSSSGESNLAAGVEEISPVLMPNSERLKQVVRKSDTIFVTAKDTWEGLAEDQKREDLQKMLEVDIERPAKVAIVIDQHGRPLGDISPEGITVHNEPKQVKVN